MSAGWVGASVRARAMSRRRIGIAGARSLAACTSLEEALEVLRDSPYAHDARIGQDLGQAQWAVASTLLWHTRILAGAHLGADWALGGGGADADSFGEGDMEKVKIGGNVSFSTIAAGIVSTPGDTFDLAWCAGTNSFVNGSVIEKLDIKGSLFGGDPAYGVGAYDIEKYKIDGMSIHPLVFTEV